MKSILSLALLVLASSFVVACGDDEDTQPAEDLVITAELTATDPVVGENTFDVEVRDADNALVADATLTVEPFMPSMGHGSGTEPTVTANGDGTFVVTAVVFTMAGDWEVTFQASTPDGRSTSYVYSTMVEGDGMGSGMGSGMDMGSGMGSGMGGM